MCVSVRACARVCLCVCVRAQIYRWTNTYHIDAYYIHTNTSFARSEFKKKRKHNTLDYSKHDSQQRPLRRSDTGAQDKSCTGDQDNGLQMLRNLINYSIRLLRK